MAIDTSKYGINPRDAIAQNKRKRKEFDLRQEQQRIELAQLEVTSDLADPMMTDSIDDATKKSDKKSEGEGGATANELSLVAGAVGGAITSILGVSAIKSDIDASNKALMTNLESQGEAMAFSQQIRAMQAADLAEVASDSMSQIAFNQTVEEATAKAVSAESGSSGSSEDRVVQTMANANFAKAKVKQDYETQSKSLMIQSAAELLSFENNQKTMLSQQMDPMNVALKVASTGMSSYASGEKLFSGFF